MSTLRFALMLAVILAVGLVLGYVLHRPEPVPVQIAHEAVRRAERVVSRTDTVFVRDTVRLTRWVTRYDTARVSDTVVRESVVYVRRDIADSTVHACRDVLSTCSASLAARDSVIASQRAEIRAVAAARPSRVATVIRGAALVAAGYALARSGVTIPIPFGGGHF